MPMTAPAPLAERIPPRAGTPPDELLDLFLGHVRTLGLELYPAQEEAILELFSGNNVILATPTGSGQVAGRARHALPRP
jgi:superfamily II RNA helicase